MHNPEYYRYRDIVYSNGCDEWGDPLPGGRTVVELETIPVIKITKCGVWIGYGGSWKRFVNRSWNKQYACPTIEEAQKSYIARKKRQIALLKGQLAYAEHALEKAITLFKEPATAAVGDVELDDQIPSIGTNS